MKKTLSVIIPTLKQWDYYQELMNQLTDQGREIKKYFAWYSVITVQWMLVNEAWNYWISKAKWDIILILNDDITISDDIWFYISQLKKWEVWCPYFSRQNNFNIVHSTNWDNIVWFCFWMYRKDWKHIPNDLKLWYWDNFIYEYMNHNIVWGWNIHHFESKTLLSNEHKEMCEQIIQQDKENWKLIQKDLSETRKDTDTNP